MILAALLLAASLALGWTLAARLTRKNQLAFAFPLAIAAGAWTLFLASLAIGFNDYSIVAAIILQAVAAAVLYGQKKPSLEHDKRIVALLVAGILLFTALQYARFHYDANGNLAGIPIDFGFHSAIITSLANGNFPPQNPFYDGHAFNYYYLTHLYSAALLKGGFPLQAATWIPIVLASAAFIALLYLYVRKLFPKREHAAVAYLAIPLVLLNGTLAFWVATPTTEFFHNALRNTGFPFENFLIDILIINQSAVLGAVIALMILLLIKEKKNTSAAILVGTLPLINAPFFVLGLSFLLFFTSIKQKIIATAMAVPQILLLQNQNNGVLSNITLHFGWMSQNQDILSILLFWINNLGPYLALSLVALYFLKNKEINKIYLTLLLPAVLANFFIFTPYAWDNFKLFLLFFMFIAILSAYALIEIWKKGSLAKIFALVLLSTMTLTGVLSLATLANHSEGLSYTRADLEACKWIEENTPKDAVFLIDNDHVQSCLFATVGRRVYLGFGEWLTNHGIDYTKQLEENKQMLAGNCSLIKEKNLTYAYFTPNVKPSQGLENQSVERYASQSQVVLELCKKT